MKELEIVGFIKCINVDFSHFVLSKVSVLILNHSKLNLYVLIER